MGCNVIYVSKVKVNENYRTSLAITGLNNDTTIERIFSEFCYEKGFQHQEAELVSPQENRDIVLQCGESRFFYVSYNIRLFKTREGYEVQLFLFQQGPWRTDTEFFCSETDEMVAHFTEILGQDNLTVIKYPGCR